MHNMYQNGTVKSQIEIVPSWQLAPYSQLPIRQLALSVERTGFNSSTYARIKPVAVTATGYARKIAGITKTTERYSEHGLSVILSVKWHTVRFLLSRDAQLHRVLATVC